MSVYPLEPPFDDELKPTYKRLSRIMCQVNEYFRYSSCTLLLTKTLFDSWILYKQNVMTQTYMMETLATCMMIASKLYENDYLDLDACVTLCSYDSTKTYVTLLLITLKVLTTF